MLTVEKKNLILSMLEKKPVVTVPELSEALETSEVTVRKILNEMDEQGLLRRTRGGAVNISTIREFEEKEKEKKNPLEKRAIAKKAYEYINNFDTVFIDAGSTTLELVKEIKNGNKRDIVVITNALNIAFELLEADDIELVFIGGSVRHKIMSCVGGFAENTIKSLCIDKAFIGCNSITVETGITTPNLYEAQVKQCVLKASRETILISDYSKFGHTSMARISPLKDITRLITDNRIPQQLRNQIESTGVDLIVVEPEKNG
ncbi:DeoR/GlpR family DNA-binding transcription regulator [Caproiciproducens sp. LBM24188]|nr:DeoR/GlpR transcriptional regulator [Oscillospiraceae bacterium]HHV31124.1 DeoR/GlpR transcriptional regulator [Clostridiales bacterium]